MNVQHLKYGFVVLLLVMTGCNSQVSTSANAKVELVDPVTKAEKLLEAGKQVEAITHLYEAIEKNNASNVKAHSLLGNIFIVLNQLDQAENSYAEALRINPDDADLHHRLGNVYLRRGDPVRALKSFQEAIRKDPTNVDANYTLGEITLASGQQELASGFFRKVLALDPNHKLAKAKLETVIKQEEALKAKQAEMKAKQEMMEAKSMESSTV